jgi:hypothetical protein
VLRAFAYVSLSGLLLAASGCGRSSLSFNNALSEANQRIAGAVEPCGEAAFAAMDGDPAAVARFKAADQNLRKVMADVKAEMQAVEVPDSPTARRLYEAHQRYLRGHEEIVNNQFVEISRMIEDASMAPEAKGQRFLELVQQIEQIESRDLVPLQQIQREYASESGFQLREP